MKRSPKKIGIYIVSVLGAAGTGLQNYMAVATLIKSMMTSAFAVSKAGVGIIHGLALSLGGICSGVANVCINIELLENFVERITQKPRPKLVGWQRFRYWFGSGVFIFTGVLFGLTAFAFGPIGPLAALGIAAGVFVAAIMAIQELETWLESFDNQKEGNKKSLKDIFKEWKASLTKSKCLGIAIAVGNVVALSLLFTMGLGSFLMGVGVPALPAIITAFTFAFTGGAFTEFYFYNRFLSSFCNNIKENWQKFWQAKHPLIGLVCGAVNALVNGVLSYVGIMMITGLLVTAGIAVPPLGVVIAVAASVAVCAGLASFILGIDFWIRNSEKLTSIFHKNNPTHTLPFAQDKEQMDTKAILSQLTPSNSQDLPILEEVKEEKGNEHEAELPAIHAISKVPAVTEGQFNLFVNNKEVVKEPTNDLMLDENLPSLAATPAR